MNSTKLYGLLSLGERNTILQWAKVNDLDCVMVRVYSSSIRFEECGDGDDACIEFKHEDKELAKFNHTALSIGEVVYGTKSWENH